MHIKYFLLPVACIMAAVLLISCQKNLGDGNGGVPAVGQKPKLGTTWYYRFDTYYPNGGLINSVSRVYKAVSEETYGGEKWLNIIDVDADTTVYFLNAKAGGLYQYSNSNSNLLCKYPAAINDTYTSFNDGSPETFTVRGVNDTLATGIGDIPLNNYEGVKTGYIIDLIWYNDNAWIVWETRYFKSPDPPIRYYLYSKMFINKIVY